MTNTITLPRSVVEQALEAFEHLVRRHYRLGTEHDSRAKALRAALEQPDIEIPASVPEGWKLVPVEPTDDMLYDIQEYSHILPPRGRRIWAHMLAAAPQPPTTEQSSVVQQQAMAWVWFDKNRKPCNVTFGGPNINTPKDWVVLPLYTHQQPPTTVDSSVVQLQGKQQPVAEVIESHVRAGLDGRFTAEVAGRERLSVGAELFVHPQNLRCKSNQARLATLWGYVKEQPPRRPLTDQQINDHRLALAYDSEDLPDPWDFKQGVRAAERAHGIGGEK